MVMSREDLIVPLAEIFPLEHTPDSILEKLCHVLWDWEDCLHCNNEGNCRIAACPWERLVALKPFFLSYKRSTSWSTSEDAYDTRHALRNHDDLLKVIETLMKRPDDSLNQLVGEYFSTYLDEPDKADQLRAFNLAIKCITMIRCSLKRSSLVRSTPIVWHGDDSMKKLIASTLPKKDPIRLHDDQGSLIGFQLTAKRLKSVHGIKFRGTDDLIRHLLLDPEKKVIYIFHHTAFLKEYLIRTKYGDLESLDILPRQLILETLDSLQRVLFPFDDGSRALLSCLVPSAGLDPDCAAFDAFEYRRDNETDVRYHYWGARLMRIYDEFGSSRSRGSVMWQWLYTRSGREYLMLVTIGGIILAALLGAGSLTLSAFQMQGDRHMGLL